MDVSNILSGLNLSRSYHQMAESPEKKVKKTQKREQPNIIVTAEVEESPVIEEEGEVVEEAHPAPVRSAPTVSEPAPSRSIPQTHTSPEKVTQPREAVLSPENLSRKDWSFVVDNEILIKELDLGKDLTSKAVDKITPEVLASIASNEGFHEEDKSLVQVHTQLVDISVTGEAQ